MGLFLLFSGVFIAQKIQQRRQPVVKTRAAVKKDLFQTVSASGEVKAEKQATLKFQTSGKLVWVGVKEGDWVEKWQAIAKLDTYELERDLVNALRDYSKERADFEEEYRVTYREQTPYTALTDTVKRILEKNQWDLDKAVADVEISQQALKLATLVTPINGLVTQIDFPLAGVNITPATATFVVADPAVMFFEAEIDEVDIGKVQLGQKAFLALDAYPDEEIETEVTKIAFVAVTTSGGGTAFPVTVTLKENPEQKFKVGLNGDLEIIVDAKKDTLAVPSEAIFFEGQETYVKVWENSQIQKVTVQTGLETDTETEILEGLKEGQLVVISEAD